MRQGDERFETGSPDTMGGDIEQRLQQPALPSAGRKAAGWAPNPSSLPFIPLRQIYGAL